ncbi:MAG: hypothetical protein GC204_17105 [Chloroflexi bacterium]|nr:hypothetical protein [Chloroflexota bacterium]
MFKRLLTAGFLLMFVIAACSPAETAAPTLGATNLVPTATTMTESAQTTDSAPSLLEAVARAGADRPTWMSTVLTNAETGATFTLADFPEKTVYVEMMATWCTNCRQQQGFVRDILPKMNADQYVFISLSVEPKDTTEGLKQYRVQYNYPWTFAVVPPDMLAQLVEQFGQSVTNPTATPHLVIAPSGSVSQLSTGIHSADQLTAELTAASGA